MPLAGAQAGVAALGKFPTRRGTPFVDAAGDLLPQLPSECGTTAGHMVGAAHSTQMIVDFDSKPTGHMPARFVQLMD